MRHKAAVVAGEPVLADELAHRLARRRVGARFQIQRQFCFVTGHVSRLSVCSTVAWCAEARTGHVYRQTERRKQGAAVHELSCDILDRLQELAARCALSAAARIANGVSWISN